MYISIRKIGNHYYKYRQHKESGKTVSKYLGKATEEEYKTYKEEVADARRN